MNQKYFQDSQRETAKEITDIKNIINDLEG